MKAAVFILLASLCCVLASKCGKRREELRRAIISGGTDALPNEFPWQVAMKKGGSWWCGGSIINEQWIVTAAHCAMNETNVYGVFVGKHDLNLNEDGQEERSVTQIRIHPLHWSIRYHYDVALMKLSSPLNLDRNTHIGPVCLPGAHDDFTGQMCTASGWGLTSPDGASANILQKVDLPVLSSEECDTIRDGRLCAGYKSGGKGTCKGDSGGPLVCQRQDSSWVLAGITSGGVGRCSGYGSPGFFTRVTSVVEWIETEIRHHD